MSRFNFCMKCNCLCFNWRTGITSISIITEAIQLTINFSCILILKCFKTHIVNIRHQKQSFFPSETINELKGKSHTNSQTEENYFSFLLHFGIASLMTFSTTSSFIHSMSCYCYVSLLHLLAHFIWERNYVYIHIFPYRVSKVTNFPCLP